MSIRVMTAAWEQPLPPAAKLVLMALADISNDDGVCWPSVRLLAGKCSLSERSVRTHLADLEQLGLLKVEQRFRKDGSQTSNRYVVLRAAPPAKDAAPAEDPTSPGGTSAPGGDEVAGRALNHQMESSEGPPPQEPCGGRELRDLRFPSALSNAERADAAGRLSVLSTEDAQLVLDELAGRCQVAPVKNPIGYLRSLITRIREGAFTPDLVLKVREHRESRERHLAAMQRREAELRTRRGPVDLSGLLPRHQELFRKHIRTADTLLPPEEEGGEG